VTERHGTRREFGGALVVCVVLAIAGVVMVGIYAGPWAALAATLGLAVLAIASILLWSTRRPGARRPEAPQVKPLDDGRYRILVVADESCGSHALVDQLKSHAGDRQALVFVMATALESRLGLLTGDQSGYDDASRRLKATIEALEAAGIPAGGEVSASDPLQGADDGLRQFPANEIVFATNPEGETNWLEEGVVTLAESRYDRPISHLLVRTTA
jgi:hypothetical protein